LFVWLDFAIAVAEHALLAALANYRQWILYTGKKELTQAKELKFFVIFCLLKMYRYII